MKRFFPILLGLTLICLSFTSVNDVETIIDNEWYDHSEISEEDAALSLIKVCRFHQAVASNGQNCSPASAELIVDPNCQGTVLASITVTNLDSDPDLGDFYPMLSNVEDIYFEYTAFNVTTVVGPILEYEHVTVKKDNNNNPYYIFEAVIEMTFDVSAICPSQQPTFFMDVRLRNLQGEDYFIGDHVESDEIWYCALFEEACGYCPPPSGCNPQPIGEELIFNGVQACGDLCTCSGPGKKLQAESIEAETHGENYTFVIESNIELDMEASPNPFTNEISLTFTDKVEKISSLQIIDMTGKEVIHQNDLRVNASSFLLDTYEIPSGVYFCKVIIDNKILTKKIIKL